MQIKAADDRQPHIRALRALLRRTDLPSLTRQRIEQEMRSVVVGEQAEKDDAYQIEFYTAKDPAVMTIHDLRISTGNRVAQIDHLIITRLLEFWVCESKSFTKGVEINEHGEWSRIYDGQRLAILSPIEQNNRHIAVLSDLLRSRLMQLHADLRAAARFKGVVLVSGGGTIKRPVGAAATHVEGLDGVGRADQLITKINKSIEGRLPLHDTTLVDSRVIEGIARQLAALHAPPSDFTKKFGLSDVHPDSSSPRRNVRGSQRRKRRGFRCESCGDQVSGAVIEYCRDYAWLFGDSVLCVPCQDDLFPYR